MSSGFISEVEIEERKKVRQKEWEKVRQPDQPLEAPEEDYDSRSLFERLEAQKQKREFEYEEAHRLKHMIKGLDDDEVEFLDLVDRSKLEEERKKSAEEAREMADFRNRVASLKEQSLENRIQHKIKTPPQIMTVNINKSSQSKLLAGAVRKRPRKTMNDKQSEDGSTEDNTKPTQSTITEVPRSLPRVPVGVPTSQELAMPASVFTNCEGGFRGMRQILPYKNNECNSSSVASDSDYSSDDDRHNGERPVQKLFKSDKDVL